MKKQIDYTDIWFTVVLESDSSWEETVWVNFKIYEMAYQDCSDGTPFGWQKKDASSSADNTSKIEEAEILGEGSLKWDGCGSLSIDSFHLCGKRTLTTLCEVLNRLWEEVAETMHKFDIEVAK